MSKQQKIRIRLKAYDHKALDQSAVKIVETGYSWVQIAPEGAYFWLTAMFDELMNAYNTTADAEARKELSWKMQALNYENAYMLPAYVLNQTVMYNTAAVEVPETALEAGGVNYCWSQWKMLK